MRWRWTRQVAFQSLAIETALKDLGVADRAVGTIRVVHAMQSEGSDIEVALGTIPVASMKCWYSGARVTGVRSKWVASRSGLRLT